MHGDRVVRFLAELRHRKVWRTLVAYLASAAATVGLADIVVPRTPLPDGTVTVVIWMAVLGIPVAAWLGWVFDVTAEGIQRTASLPPDQALVSGSPTSRPAVLGGGLLVLLLLATVIWVRPWAAGAGLRDILPTGRLLPLTSDQVLDLHPTWSPDGSLIAFGRVADGDMDLYVMGLNGEPRFIGGGPADDISPRYSPDGTRIAFLSDRGSGMELFWISPTGGRERRITGTRIPLLDFGTVWFRGLGAQPWSPDGERILYPRLEPSGAIALWMVTLETGETSRITEPASGALDLGAAWSPDGRSVLFDRTEDGRSSLHLASGVGSGTIRTRALTGPSTSDFGAAWLPDGSGFAFISDRSGAVSPWVASLDDLENATPLPSPARWVYHLAVGPDGSVAMATADHHSDLWLGEVGAPASEHRNITRDSREAFGASFRSATHVGYHSDRAGNHDLWIYDTVEDRHRPLTESPSFEAMPDWSPDGDLVFASDRGGMLRPWVLEEGASEPRLLLDRTLHMSCDQITVYCRGPRWSPDGERVGMVLEGAEGRELWLVDADGSDAEWIPVEGLLSFDWIRDHRRLVYARVAPAGDGREIRLRHLETGEDELLLAGFYMEPSVAPDGRRLALLRSRSHYHMDAVDVSLAWDGELPTVTGPPRALTQGEGRWHTHNLAWSPDGRHFAYTRDTDGGDLWVLPVPESP